MNDPTTASTRPEAEEGEPIGPHSLDAAIQLLAELSHQVDEERRARLRLEAQVSKVIDKLPNGKTRVTADIVNAGFVRVGGDDADDLSALIGVDAEGPSAWFHRAAVDRFFVGGKRVVVRGAPTAPPPVAPPRASDAEALAFRYKVKAHAAEAEQMGEDHARAMDPHLAAETLGIIAEVGRLHQAVAVLAARWKIIYGGLEASLPKVEDHLADDLFGSWSRASGTELVGELFCSIAAMAEDAGGGDGPVMDPVTAAHLLGQFRGSGALVEAARRGVA